MEVIIRKDAIAATQLAACIIKRNIELNPSIVLGLATGRTMEQLYAHLVNFHNTDNLDFSLSRSFNLDEYVGLPPDDKHSYRSYMNNHLFDKVNIDLRNTFIPNGMADDLSEECKNYETKIQKIGGIDLQLLGLGDSGHIGFNEPLSALKSLTRVKALTPETIEQNAQLFDKPENMPRRAITMGVGTILNSKRCIMVVTGFKKAKILQMAVEGPITSMVTASALQLHPHASIICDKEAAKLLKGKEYYEWVFKNEPEWADYQ